MFKKEKKIFYVHISVELDVSILSSLELEKEDEKGKGPWIGHGKV